MFCLLAAFRLRASVPAAGLVMVVAGLSTLVPLTPGGAGKQQAMVAYAMHQTVTTAAAVSFSLGMQAGVTVVNALLGIAAAMVAFRTLAAAGGDALGASACSAPAVAPDARCVDSVLSRKPDAGAARCAARSRGVRLR